jgi:hypothetical protein
MAIVKCQNPHCDYFQKPVPEGDFCPFCGDPLPTNKPLVEERQPQPLPETQPPPQPFVEPQPQPLPEPTVVELPSLTLIHTSGRKFPILEKTAYKKVYLGRRGGSRQSQPEIDLTELPYSERVSRPHAYIFWDASLNNYMIVDDRSANGTIVNDQSLVPGQPYRLNDGDRLEFGREHRVIFDIQLG